MDRLFRDLIVSFRRLRSSPGFTVAAILTLALGIGANTTIFSLVNAIVFRPLGVQHQNELAFFNMRTSKAEFPALSYPDFKDYRERNTVFTDMSLYRIAPMNMSRGGGVNSRLWGYEVTGNYFAMLGVNAIRGRVLRAEDDAKKGGSPFAVISYNCWQRRFAADPDIAGKKVKVNGLDFTILGVTPAGFVGTELIFTPEIWVPITMVKQIEGFDWTEERRDGNGFVIGRLKPGVSMQSAQAAINSIAVQLGREYPLADAGISIVLSPPGMAGTYLRGAITGFSAVLMVVAGMVLLIACVNLASLLLARAADRGKDTAIRLALGASRSILVRQLLTESMVLSIAGGAAGIFLALWLTDLVNAWTPPIDVPVIPHVTMDLSVMLFAAVISFLTGVLFGLAPAIQSTRSTLAGAMRNDAPSNSLRRVSLRDLLVITQVALSVVLLIGSVLVVRSLQHALSLHLGFEPRHAAVISYDLGLQGYNEEQAREFQRRLLDKVRSTPGIEAAGLIDGLPLTLNISNSAIFLEGKPEPRAGDAPLANMYSISPGYLKAMGTKLVAGRDLDQRDKKDAPLTVLVNETFARQLLPGEDPVGKRFRHGASGQWRQIVGVVEDGKYRSLGESPSPTVFRSMEQNGEMNQTLVARSPLPEEETARALRRAVAELDPSLTVYDAGSLTSELALALFPARLVAVVLSSFGLLAVVLAATGVYGIMAYAVSRRTREIGIRMALGAGRNAVLSLVMRDVLAMLCGGLAVGLLMALALARFLAHLLYRVDPRDLVAIGAATLVLACVALAAGAVPCLRAFNISPSRALRYS